LTHGHAAGEFIKEARVIPLEQFLYNQIVVADTVAWHRKRKGPRA
jgi:hypothetical protein